MIVGPVTSGQAPGVAFRTPTFAFVAADDTNPNVVYVAYQHLSGDYDVYVQRSTNGGATWGAAVQVNEDPGGRHQIFPTIDVSNGDLHVAWYDFRNSVLPINEALDVYYASSNTSGVPYPAFSHNERVTDVSHNGNCRMFGAGASAFHGDYIELDARWDGANHIVHVYVRRTTRDVTPLRSRPGARSTVEQHRKPQREHLRRPAHGRAVDASLTHVGEGSFGSPLRVTPASASPTRTPGSRRRTGRRSNHP